MSETLTQDYYDEYLKYKDQIENLLISLTLYHEKLKNNQEYNKLIRSLKGTLEVLDMQWGINMDYNFLKLAKEKASKLLMGMDEKNEFKN